MHTVMLLQLCFTSTVHGVVSLSMRKHEILLLLLSFSLRFACTRVQSCTPSMIFGFTSWDPSCGFNSFVSRLLLTHYSCIGSYRFFCLVSWAYTLYVSWVFIEFIFFWSLSLFLSLSLSFFIEIPHIRIHLLSLHNMYTEHNYRSSPSSSVKYQCCKTQFSFILSSWSFSGALCTYVALFMELCSICCVQLKRIELLYWLIINEYVLKQLIHNKVKSTHSWSN